MSGKVSFYVLISGRVQGVGYRYSTREKAISLGVSGWVRNLTSGQVEALVVGSAEAVNALLDWFQEGPPTAKVTVVETEQKEPMSFETFEIRR